MEMEMTAEAAPSAPAKSFQTLDRRQLIGTIIGLQLTLLLAALDNTIVGTAMPKIIGQLNGTSYSKKQDFDCVFVPHQQYEGSSGNDS